MAAIWYSDPIQKLIIPCDLQPWLSSNLRLHDTCGVHNLHGMPALISAVASAIYASMVTADDYQSELQDIFPAMAGSNSTATKIMGVS